MIMKCPYQTCTTWLHEKAVKLTELGFSVEVKENAAPMHSLFLKIASSNTDAELVVWENGATSMIVVNLASNHYDLDRHDIVLVGNHYERDLEVFFNLLK